ncbi:MAG: hypothetical protein IK121_00285 [Lachnospiraceae bacterium]|nr:hypothetical protein [Lachnospiraceae bacterium]
MRLENYVAYGRLEYLTRKTATDMRPKGANPRASSPTREKKKGSGNSGAFSVSKNYT